jgi:hypothetical protein
VLYLQLIILSVICDVFVDNEMFLVTDFMNLKIKPSQSFKIAHRNKMYIHSYGSYCILKKQLDEVLT